MILAVKQLGLAAFINMKGATLLRIENGAFIYESNITLEDWHVQYANSCCRSHDALVCELRSALRRS